MDGPEMRQVRDVVDDFLWVLVELPEVVNAPAHPLRVVPFGVHRHVVVGLATFRVMPYVHAPHLLHYRPGAHGGRLRDGAVVVGNVVALAIRAEAPGMVRAANGVAFHLSVQHCVRGSVLGHMRAHVWAVGVQQDDLPAFLATVQGEVLTEETHRRRRAGHLGSICHHEPAARKGEFAQAVVFSRGHATPSGTGKGRPQSRAEPGLTGAARVSWMLALS